MHSHTSGINKYKDLCRKNTSHFGAHLLCLPPPPADELLVIDPSRSVFRCYSCGFSFPVDSGCVLCPFSGTMFFSVF